MSRENDRPAPQDTGRMGFREPHEPPDERPPIARDEFWNDRAEQATYEHAVETNPRRPEEGSISYIKRIIALVEHRYAQINSMPRPRMSEQEYQKRKRQLELQRDGSR